MKCIKRREFIEKSALVLAGAGMLAPLTNIAGQRKGESFRLYFITDTHLENESSDNHAVRLNSLKHFVDAVNKDPNCDLAFHLGDLCQGGNYDGLLEGVSLWSEINGLGYVDAAGNVDYPWYALGNHEVNTRPPEEFVDKFRQTRTSEGGSAWNGQFSYEKSGYKLHFLMLDCLFDANNERSKRTDGLHKETVAWIKDILQTTDADMLVLMSHAMPHYHRAHGAYYWGRSAQGSDIVDIVDEALVSNDNLGQVVWFAGHWHGSPWNKAVRYTKLSDNLIGYRIPPAQDANARYGKKGVYSVVEISSKGEIFVENVMTPSEY